MHLNRNVYTIHFVREKAGYLTGRTWGSNPIRGELPFSSLPCLLHHPSWWQKILITETPHFYGNSKK